MSTRMLRDALEKLRLNDASFNFEPESSVALGFGFRCGFLGLLHLEIIQERLEREYDLDLIITAPGVRYKITHDRRHACSRWTILRAGRIRREIETIEEPVIMAKILTNEEYVGGILKLVEDKRGRQQNIEYVSETRVMLTYELPLNEIVLDFYDRLKSVSRGYASLDYHLAGHVGFADGEDGHPDRRRAGGRAVDHRAPGLRVRPRQGAGVEDARADSAADVRGGDPGGDRRRRSSRARR